MSQTNGGQCPSPTSAPFNEDIWNFQAHGIQQSLILAALPTVLHGVFTTLCAASMYALTKRVGKIRIPSIVLALTLVALFTSTTVYFVYTILSTHSTILNNLLYSAKALWPLSPSQVLEPPGAALFKDYSLAQQCARTAALSVNILLGDAIVCWRACVLWQGSRAIRGICTAFLLATFGLGLVDIKYTCERNSRWTTDPGALGAGFLYSGFSYGVAASALSFSTNLWATVLVAYKALVSRRFIRKHVIAGSLGLQTERVLSLLVESGAFYCAVWAIVVVWQIGTYRAADVDAGNSSFWEVYGVVITGTLVPIIAIYPTIIIILVGLNRSQIEQGFEREDSPGGPSPARMPLRTLTVTIGSVEEMQADTRQAEMQDAVDFKRTVRGRTAIGSPSAEELKVSQVALASVEV